MPVDAAQAMPPFTAARVRQFGTGYLPLKGILLLRR